MYTEKRRGRIVGKYTSRGMQPLNGKLWWTDFPFERPRYYYLQFANGDTISVSEASYHGHSVGSTISYTKDIWEFEDYALVGIGVLAVLLFVGALIFASSI